jgi:hypothetical protein
VAEHIEVSFESFLRATLKAEAASLPVSIGPAAVLQRRESRRRDRSSGWTRMLATAASLLDGEAPWRAWLAPHRQRPVLIVLVLSLLLALALAIVAVGSRLPDLLTSIVPPPPSFVPTQRIAVGPAPTSPPHSGAIALVSSGDGSQRGIVLVHPSGGDRRPLTPPLIEMLDRNGCVRDTDLDVARTAAVDDMTWSPDGQALAFQLAAGQLDTVAPRPSCGLFVVSSDGQTLVRLLPAPDWEAPAHYSQTWAPNGSQIAVALRQSVALVPLDGSDLVDLGRPCEGCQPMFVGSIGGWSPDGSLIAAQFVDHACCADDTTYYIAVVDVVTAEWTLLWSGTKQEGPTGQTGYDLIGWLSDGRVAALSDQGVFAAQPDEPAAWTTAPFLGPFVNSYGQPELGLWSPDQTRAALDDSSASDGLRVRHLTTGRIDAIADWVGVHPLAWSPDGEQLAVVRTLARELWLIEADGGNPRHVASGSGYTVAWQPVWP